MKVKLLKKLRKEGMNQINILSITKKNDCIIGMRIGYNDHKYDNLFELGDSEHDVRIKAMKIYISDYLIQKKKQIYNQNK